MISLSTRLQIDIGTTTGLRMLNAGGKKKSRPPRDKHAGGRERGIKFEASRLRPK